MMERFIELANEITDPDLREKTIKMIQNPFPTNPDWRHLGIEFRKSPASTNMHHCYSGGLMEHTISVVKISSAIADVLASVHNADVNRDVVLAGALLHDIMKPITYEEGEKGYNASDGAKILDHILLATVELYRRDFPISVVHVVAAHHGKGSTIRPLTLEALAVHLADTLDAELNNNVIEGAKRISNARLKELGCNITQETLKKLFDNVSPYKIVITRQKDGRDAVRKLVKEALDVSGD